MSYRYDIQKINKKRWICKVTGQTIANRLVHQMRIFLFSNHQLSSVLMLIPLSSRHDKKYISNFAALLWRRCARNRAGITNFLMRHTSSPTLHKRCHLSRCCINAVSCERRYSDSINKQQHRNAALTLSSSAAHAAAQPAYRTKKDDPSQPCTIYIDRYKVVRISLLILQLTQLSSQLRSSRLGGVESVHIGVL
jgi:hypothetical protein